MKIADRNVALDKVSVLKPFFTLTDSDAKNI